MNPKEKEILKTFHDFWKIWSQRKNALHTINDLIPYFDKNLTALGTGEHEKGRNYNEVIQNFTDDFIELQSSFEVDFFFENVKLFAPTVGLVEAEAMLIIPVENDNPINFHLRFSTTFIYSADRWLIAHNHASIPSYEQNVGEAYPIDALKAKNDRLQVQVSQRTKQLEERTKQLQNEKDKTEKLLYNILPKIIAKELIETGKNIPARHEQTSVLFTDFVEFTKVAANIPAKKLVEELNEIFFRFDDIIKSENLEKIKTIGDSYMAVCGLPEENEQHALQCVSAAKQMLEFLAKRNRRNSIQWKMRIGIHSGPVIAGVVGKHKFTYDLWGNTVNLASRMEAACEVGKINISEETHQLIKDKVQCIPRGKIKVKGKQEIDMYFVQ